MKRLRDDEELATEWTLEPSDHTSCWANKVSPLTAFPDPPNLIRLKLELSRRWPATSLLDMLKEVDLRIRFTEHFVTSGAREHVDRLTLQKRLLLCLYVLVRTPASSA